MELYFIRHGLARQAPHIHAPIAGQGLIEFMPVRVDAVQGAQLKTTFLWNPYPLVERAALDELDVPYCFYMDGICVSTVLSGVRTFRTMQDAHECGPIFVSEWIQAGDILLASRRRPELR